MLLSILYNSLTGLAFCAGLDAVIVDFGSAALGLGVDVEAAALFIVTGLVAAPILSREYLVPGLRCEV